MRMINLDMDGVVADFNLWVGDLLGRQVSWNDKDLTDSEWDLLSKQERIYYKLPLIPESVELVLLAKTLAKDHDMGVRFLTAIPRRTTIPSAEQDKREWVEKYFPGVPMEIGPFSKDKQRWCQPLDILVDDKHLNVMQWLRAGGVAVYHTGNMDATLHNLKKAVNMTMPAVFGAIGK